MTLRNRPRVSTGSPKVLFGESKAASRSLISSAVRGVLYGTAGAAPAVLSVEYVIVAGGAGGGTTNNSYTDNATGGGGAGGYRSSVTGEPSGGGAVAETALVPLLGYAYPVIVGAGGGGAAGGYQSKLGITALGGGRAAYYGASAGGSGGGASSYATGGFTYSATGGAGTAGQGFAGGDSPAASSNAWAGAGGGGASEAGENGSAVSKGGDGGDGLTTNITGTPISLAGGGGGADLRDAGFGTAVAGLGGLGGGADGRAYTGSATGITSPGLNATANTGGGGGGTIGRSFTNTGGSGGSGRVLFKVNSQYDSEITFTPGVVYTTTTVGDSTVYDITAAGSTDTVTFGTQTDYAWSLASPSYSTESLDVSAQTTAAMGLTFSPDGTQLWVGGFTNETIYEYAMSTPYDIANATFVQSATFAYGASVRCFRWKSDGTSLFTSTNSPAGTVYEYSVSTPYDISTRNAIPVRTHSFTSLTFYDIDFAPDGTKMWGMASNDRVYEYKLNVPWNISTETYVANIYVITLDNSMTTVKWKPDGTRYYLAGTDIDKVFEFVAPEPFTVTSSFAANEYYIGTEAAVPYGIDFKSDGTEMFVTDYNLDKVHKYNLIP